MLLQQIIDIIESAAPRTQQEQWDNTGLQIGNSGKDIQSVLLTVDVTEAVVNEAIKEGCDMIISHHPLFFHPIRQVTDATPQQRCLINALQHDIAIYSCHTSIDKCLHGVSGTMAEQLGLTNYTILAPDPSNSILDPAPDTPDIGLGVIGALPYPIPYTTLLQHIKKTFHTTYIRYTAPVNEHISTIALCGGAGAELLEIAIAKGADAFISADFKYHEMQAAQGRIMAIDIDHWLSEQFTRQLFAQLLHEHLHTRIAQSDYTPIQLFD